MNDSPISHCPRRRRRALGLAAALALAAVLLVTASAGSSSAGPFGWFGHGGHETRDGLGIQPGKIKHVWLIILENKSYDATFTGLNNNTYLWHTLPSQGVLLKDYYGTGHYSLDNYISLVSGQATEPDTQADCPYYDTFGGSLDKSGSLFTNQDFGQFVSGAGVNAAAGSNGCVYPSSVQTLFNQLDAAHVSWKGYAQDLGNPDASSSGTLQNPGTGQSHDAGIQYCGAPYASPGPTGSTAYPNPGAANATDQYVPKHFPFPWFESILQSGDCNSQHIANLFDPGNGLYHDLQHANTTPAFSWITPDNCSDAHDAVCHGNNLSGGFSGPNTPNPPINYTGGLYASDLFLEHVIPEIEASPAFKEGGLIDITFDEAFPPFTYTGNSFANSTSVPPTAATSIASDSAAETLFGHEVNWEPEGPNTPLKVDASGDQLWPGDGDNAYIDRDTSISGLVLGGGDPIGGSSTGGARSDSASGNTGSSIIQDSKVTLTDVGRSVTDTTDAGSPIPANCVVANVVDTPTTATSPSQSGGSVDTGQFTLTCNGVATDPTGAVTKINLGPETASSDPLYDRTDPTMGGGDTGSVLISPYIRPGTVSTRYYNHYSWLRTMEDLFDVGRASRGIDGQGHIGYAAQPGLAPFGRDVFNRPQGPWGH
ncbi:MAG TPA: alkaline phosphatase family protein [Gaiellaceae bacterium]|nr:alkaline phosphatase family protein [Gaiellaceae bacterium]